MSRVGRSIAWGRLRRPISRRATRRERNRRTIYTFQQRSLIDPMMEVFNGPTGSVVRAARDVDSPDAGFSLFNGQFVNDMALAFRIRDREGSRRGSTCRSTFQLRTAVSPMRRNAAVASALGAKTLD